MSKILHHTNIQWIIGIDEVGRGPIAGPVMMGAFAMRVNMEKGLKKKVNNVTDSKKLSEKKRIVVYTELMHMIENEPDQYTYALTAVSALQIDKKGIGWALRTALRKCLEKLKDYGCTEKNSYVLLDGGLWAPEQYPFQKTIIKGDISEVVISAASILAKVTRDIIMKGLSQKKKYSVYGFEQHKGYGTQAHYRALQNHGLSDLHRKTWIL